MIHGKCKICGGDTEDYECHGCQRLKIQELEDDIKALCDMLTETYFRNNRAEVIEMGVPDWVVMAHSLAEAKEGKGSSIDSIIEKLGGKEF